MNYIQKLQDTVEKQAVEIRALRAVLQNIREYLDSPKFQGVENNFVNPADIRLRISEGLRHVSEIVNEQ